MSTPAVIVTGSADAIEASDEQTMTVATAARSVESMKAPVRFDGQQTG
jgi:hypothetical protein